MTNKSTTSYIPLPALLYVIFGIYYYILGLAGIISFAATITLVLLIAGPTFFWIKKSKIYKQKYTISQKILFAAIVFSVAINLPLLYLPDISFDAVWYHLPLARLYALTGVISYPKEIAYNALPRLGDLVLSAGFSLTGYQYAVRAFSVISTLLLLYYTYHLARLYVSKTASLAITAATSSLGIIGWQMTTAYTDIPQAMIQLASLYALIHYTKTRSSQSLLSFIVLTAQAFIIKPQGIMHVISSIITIWVATKLAWSNKSLITITIIITTTIFASPFLLENYTINQHILYPLNTTHKQLDQLSHAGVSSTTEWMVKRLITVVLFPANISFNHASHTTPALLLAAPALILTIIQKKLQLFDRLGIIYCLIYALLWHFTPPPESRYIITLFPFLFIIITQALMHTHQKYPIITIITIAAIIFTHTINIAGRAVVLVQKMPYIIGTKSTQQYIADHTSPFNRAIITNYYAENSSESGLQPLVK